MKISLLGGWQSYHRYSNSLTPAAKIVSRWFIFIPDKHPKNPKKRHPNNLGSKIFGTDYHSLARLVVGTFLFLV